MNDQRSLRQRAPSGTGFSQEAVDLDLLLILILIFMHSQPRRQQSRLGCRPNADDAEWAEPHGCGESAARTWMSVRRGPTERRRSEGTLRNEGPSQEQAPLVTWGAFPSNSPKAKQSAPRQTPLILILILISRAIAQYGKKTAPRLPLSSPGAEIPCRFSVITPHQHPCSPRKTALSASGTHLAITPARTSGQPSKVPT